MVALVNVQIVHIVEIYYLTQRIQIDNSIFYIFNRSKEFNKFFFILQWIQNASLVALICISLMVCL